MMNESIEVSGGLPTENLMKKLLSHKPFKFWKWPQQYHAEDADKDTYIPPNDEAETTDCWIGSPFPHHSYHKAKITSLNAFPTLANQMSSIMSTTTVVPTSALAWTVGAGTFRGAAVSMGSGSSLISWALGRDTSGLPAWDSCMSGRNARGNPSGAPPPAGGNPSSGGGSGGVGNLPQQAPLTDKMVSKEPGTFDGSRNKVEDFLTEWGAYQGLNHCTYTMDTSYEWLHHAILVLHQRASSHTVGKNPKQQGTWLCTMQWGTKCLSHCHLEQHDHGICLHFPRYYEQRMC